MSKEAEEFIEKYFDPIEDEILGLDESYDIVEEYVIREKLAKLMQAYADKVKLEHTIEALDDLLDDEVDEITGYDDVEVILMKKTKYQKQLEQLKTK